MHDWEELFKYLNNPKLTKSLKVLHFSGMDCFNLQKLCLTFLSSQMNLTLLHLKYIIVKDNLLQVIFKKLLSLRELNLESLLECVSLFLFYSLTEII